MMPIWLDLLLAFFILVGASFALVGSYGLAKLGDFYKRLHGPSKASTLGLGAILLANIVYFTFTEGRVNVHVILITLFIFLATPVSAHLLIKAAIKRRRDESPPKF